MNKLIIYVGLALTGAPPEFRDTFQHELKSELRRLLEVEVLDFVGLENGTALDVYLHDRKCAQSADLCLFVVDHASIGLGMEIMIRHHSGRQMLFFAHFDSVVTRMLTGYLEHVGKILQRYQSVADIISSVREYKEWHDNPD